MNADFIKEELLLAGFNLFAVLKTAQIDGLEALLPGGSLLLIGNAGDALWSEMPVEYLQRQNPIDEYTLECVETVLQKLAGEVEWCFLFPESDYDAAVPNLQSLGAAAGWHHESPLGNGINDQNGLWFAYRAVVWISSPLQVTAALDTVSPCLSCDGKPCIQACPADALSVDQSPNLLACSVWRAAEGSSCGNTCLARISCPIAPQWRYSDEQIAYYYNYSLPALLRWIQQRDGRADILLP